VIFDKGVQAMQWIKVKFSINGAGATRYPHVKIMDLSKTLHPSQKLTQSRSEA
jgi:hypothetical protein